MDFANFPPELMELSVLPERNDLLQEQLARAEALRTHAITPHTTGIGAALGGLGDVLTRVAGGQQAGHARSSILDNLAKAQALRALYARQAMQQQQPLAGASAWRGGMSDGGAVDPRLGPDARFGPEI